jgi:hypothetical protein
MTVPSTILRRGSSTATSTSTIYSPVNRTPAAEFPRELGGADNTAQQG